MILSIYGEGDETIKTLLRATADDKGDVQYWAALALRKRFVEEKKQLTQEQREMVDRVIRLRAKD